MIQKIIGNKREFECPDCEIEQELFLFEGMFYMGREKWSKEEQCHIGVPQKRRVYICQQCAQEAESGSFVQFKKHYHRRKQMAKKG